MALDFDSVAHELYGLVPGEFTSIRDTRAAEARRAGEAELAAAIKGLKRPTSSAWLVNLLVRRQPEQVDDLLDLGAAMREAQGQFAGGELRKLSQQRRQVVSALGRAAEALARDIGQPVSEAAKRELESTLEAALADPAAGDLVRSGRLTAALTSSGLGSPDQAGALAPAAPATSARARNTDTRRPRTSEMDDTQRRRQRREAAEQALLEAEGAATAARDEASELAGRMGEAREEHRRLRQAVRDQEAQLEHLQTEQAAAALQLRDAEQTHQAADRSAKAAERRADHARRALERLGD